MNNKLSISFKNFIENLKIDFFDPKIIFFYKKYPNFIPRQNLFLIKNNFKEIKDHYPDEFMFFIYFLDYKSCKIITIRTDQDNGWDKNVTIKLFDSNNDEFEVISIGSSSRNIKIIELETSIELIKNIEYTKLKKNIHIIQINNTNNFINYDSYLTFSSIIYTQFFIDYYFINQQLQRKFIKYYFADKLDYYDLLKNDNIKNIFFICLYLYINGGIYCSNYLKLTKSINSNKNKYLLDKNMELLFISTEKNNIHILKYLEYLLLYDIPKILSVIKKNFEELDDDDYDFNMENNYIYDNNKINNEIDIDYLHEDSNDIITKCIENINKNYIFYDIESKNIYYFFHYKIFINSEIDYTIKPINRNYYILERCDKEIIDDKLELFFINENTENKNIVIFEQIYTNKKYDYIEQIFTPDNDYFVLFRFL
jgi:hypothetical protein